jgi:hypothetical protein
MLMTALHASFTSSKRVTEIRILVMCSLASCFSEPIPLLIWIHSLREEPGENLELMP